MYIVSQLPEELPSGKLFSCETTVLLFQSLQDAHRKAHVLANKTRKPTQVLLVAATTVPCEQNKVNEFVA